jgi:photosystem II stability/assembly factor-like uncharacterized protein
MRPLVLLFVTLTALQPAVLPMWVAQASSVTARLRGASAATDQIVWASGSNGTIVRTADGGATWTRVTVANAEKLDFRDIDAVSEHAAYALSIGNGEQSRIFKTEDDGRTWQEQFVNRDPKGFLDAMAFWDADHGIAFGDSIDGQFFVLRTENGGREWARVPQDRLPPALPNEGAFAASGTNIALVGRERVWIGTGAAARARVLRSSDGGRTWQVADTAIASSESSGIFSVAFRDAEHGIVVGGDYRREREAGENAAVTSDGGVTWTAVAGLSGFRSVVAYLPTRNAVVAVGPSGTDYSTDDGQHWTAIPGPGFHTFTVAKSGGAGWGAGENGTIARMTFAARALIHEP